MFNTLDIGASALMAQRTRLDTIAGNIANINTTRNARGELSPYQRRLTIFAPGQAGDTSKAGVHVQQIMRDPSPFIRRYEPGSPDAGKDGYVSMPNVDLAIETVNAMECTRAYEANVTMMDVTKSMLNSTLRLIA